MSKFSAWEVPHDEALTEFCKDYLEFLRDAVPKMKPLSEPRTSVTFDEIREAQSHYV